MNPYTIPFLLYVITVATFIVFLQAFKKAALDAVTNTFASIRVEERFNELWDGRPHSRLYTWRKVLHTLEAEHSSPADIRIAKKMIKDEEQKAPTVCPSSRTVVIRN